MCAARDPGPLSLPGPEGDALVSNRKPSRPERVAGFLERTDPLVIQAMQKCFNRQWGDPALTVEEQAALDSYLAPRLAALAEELVARMNGSLAPIGPGPRRRRS